MTGARVIAFLASTDPDAAVGFYRDALGLTLVEDSPFALVFESGGTTLRIQKVGEFSPQPFTALGWAVDDIVAAVRELGARGIAMDRFPGVPQDDDAIWTTPDGARVAWFHDPDGNVLSLTQAAPA